MMYINLSAIIDKGFGLPIEVLIMVFLIAFLTQGDFFVQITKTFASQTLSNFVMKMEGDHIDN